MVIYSDEIVEFLNLCLRSRWESKPLQNWLDHTQAEKFDWTSFLNLIEDERLSPLIYYLLSNSTWIPEFVRKDLEKVYLSVATHNAILFRDLGNYLTVLAANQIDAMILKGAALASLVYPNIAMRPMVDLDILVNPKDVTHAINILQNDGYRIVRQEEQPGFTLNYENEIALLKRDVFSKMVEIHWSLFNSIYYQYKIPTSMLWNSTQTIMINQTPVLTLNPEMNIIHLCGHLSVHHSGKGWLWIHDLAEIIKHFEKNLDWKKLIELAEQFDLVLALKSNLSAVTDLYGQILPAEFLQALNRLEPSGSEIKYFTSLSKHHKSPGKTFLEDLSCLPDWRKKLHFAFSNIFPSITYMKIRYRFNHPLMLPVFYLYRWYLGITSIFKNPSGG